uniref:Uncharacterized protein n=1 Tax=Arundo donax TaxID=35708 RepID=A0A0A9HL23_ARUDO
MILAQVPSEEYLQQLDQVELHEDHWIYYEIVSYLLQLMVWQPHSPQSLSLYVLLQGFHLCSGSHCQV